MPSAFTEGSEALEFCLGVATLTSRVSSHLRKDGVLAGLTAAIECNPCSPGVAAFSTDDPVNLPTDGGVTNISAIPARSSVDMLTRLRGPLVTFARLDNQFPFVCFFGGFSAATRDAGGVANISATPSKSSMGALCVLASFKASPRLDIQLALFRRGVFFSLKLVLLRLSFD